VKQDQRRRIRPRENNQSTIVIPVKKWKLPFFGTFERLTQICTPRVCR
jgi:hypothetical protein